MSPTEFKPVLLGRVGKPDSQSLATYRADGGYEALAKSLKMANTEVIDLVKNSGLRGRGGAGFPTGLKWTFLPKDVQGPIYLCINGDESEPGTFNNRVLIEEDPHQVLEGIVISSFATRATTAYFYLRYEYGRCYRALQKAVDEMYANNLLGKNILGSGYDLDIYLHRGACAYICGEETGLIESLEGKRAWPRIKPPFPAIEGAFRRPTVVNNVETMACIPHIINHGAEWFQSMGIPKDPNNPRDAGSYGPKLYCISGHVNKPGLVELPMGISARDLIDQHAGGVWKGRKAKAVIPGGLSMGFMTNAELDTPLDFNGPGRVGCLVVIDDQTSMIDVLYNACRFFAHESCGQCTPCREGTAWSTKILERIREGKGKLSDIDLLMEIANSIGTIPGTTICGLADGAAWPIKTAINKFRGEFEEYIKSGRRSESLALAGAH
jgi:NADH-quinone oxidoreductase subunit F